MPSNCYQGQGPFPYTKAHNPAVRYSDITSDLRTCRVHVVPYSSFDPNDLRRFSLVIPNMTNDMHTGTRVKTQIAAGDEWLHDNVPAMLDAGAEVIITFDEGNSTTEHIVTLEVGGPAVPGSTDATAYTHYSVLAGLENHFKVPLVNGAQGATPLPL